MPLASPDLPSSGVADEDDVFFTFQEGESCQLLDLGLADAGLLIKREGFQGPVPGDSGLFEPIGLAALLAVDMLLDEKTMDHPGDGGCLLFRSLKFMIEGLGHSHEV